MRIESAIESSQQQTITAIMATITSLLQLQFNKPITCNFIQFFTNPKSIHAVILQSTTAPAHLLPGRHHQSPPRPHHTITTVLLLSPNPHLLCN
jgi:hypothetical protein